MTRQVRKTVVQLLLYFIISCVGEGALAKDPALIFSQNQDALVFIKVTSTRSDTTQASESGTGFIVSETGYIFTNNHLFDVLHAGDTDLIVTAAVGSRYRTLEQLDVIERNPQLDLALLRFKDVSRKRQRVIFGAPENVVPGNLLYLMGFPEGFDAAIAGGNLSSLGGPSGTWQTTLPANRGNSGGPVFDVDGRVVSIVRADLGPGVSGISFVIPINLARSLLGMVPGIATPPPPDIKTADRTNLVVEGSGPNFMIPRISGRTLDGCIKSPQFPEFVGMQCTPPARQAIAEAFCRLAGYRLAASFQEEWTASLKSSLKYTEEIDLDNKLTARWVPDNTGGDVFTQIVCIN